MRAPSGVLEDIVRLPDADTREDVFPSLRELQAHPELLEEPEPVIPRLAFRGRTTGFVAPDKSGKSTLAGEAVAAKSRGRPFLGERVDIGNAIVAAPDEAVGDTVRRLTELNADPDRVRVLTLHPPNLLGKLNALLETSPADLLVVDSLAEYARLTLGRAPDDGDAAGWGAIVRPLVQLSRERDVGVLLLHHPRRSDGQYRGSGEIAAALDCLLEMTMPNAGEDPTLRRFRGRARWPVENFALRMEEGQYVLGGGGPLSLDARVLLHVEANPGESGSAVRKAVGGRTETVLAALDRLVDRGAIQKRGTESRPAYYAAPHQVEMEAS